MITDWKEKYSKIMKDFEGYSIGKIFKYLNDPEIISLAGGLPSPDMFQKTQMREVSKKLLENNLENIFQYTAVPGEESLKSAIIEFLKRDNINITKEQVVVTSSGQHGLDLTGRLFLNSGDVIMIDRPTFAGAIVAFQMQNPQIIGIDMENDGPNVDEYRKILEEIDEKPKFIYVVPDFQNPTGITTSLAKREALLDLSNEFGIPIIEDSPYRDLRYRGESIPSLFSLDQKRNGTNVIGLYTFSKIFCPGIRVGFNIGPKDVIEKMGNIKGGNILNTPKYNQDLCTAFLTEMDYDAHMEKCKTYYSEKLNVFLQSMQKYFPNKWGVKWTKPEGGLFLWVSLPKKIDTMKLFYEAIKYKVAFVPGEVFFGENPSKNEMRINFSFASKEQIVEAVRRLAECVKAQL
ncbi:MAG: PLP-dependent aminotransferase family protein [Candidatus Tenebribacter burtonii]|jgi:2-aminoadipate transaminase|nr:PLP-dependent aminotransferase family protein [Candidatus Tenebribacter burtonii]